MVGTVYWFVYLHGDGPQQETEQNKVESNEVATVD